MSRIRIGIDVGGTFTKAVAIDFTANGGRIIAKKTVPTTHLAKRGVSEGIIQVLRELIGSGIGKDSIELVAHSTTQAVNALLEGDVARVGVVGMGVGLEKSDVVKRTNVGNIRLGEKHIKTCYRFVDTSKILAEKDVDSVIYELKNEGAEVIVASEAFGVDDASNEAFVVKRARKLVLPATAGYELTGVYGLEIRTLTAAINASILPTTIKTANFVEDALKQESIKAPLMIMKGDGGITDIHTFRTKPILTILSGPAASVAGALLYLRIIDGIFIEVGGTSTNICVIKNGRPELKYVTIMDHPTCIRSLDVRVVGVAGGSMIRLKGKKITDVGPRSAHIAGLPYSCFANIEELEDGEIVLVKPREDDPEDYVAIKVKEKMYAITNTCAANALGLIKEDDYAYADREVARAAIAILARKLESTVEDIANRILEISSKKVERTINLLIKQYELDNITLIGGGGGASVLVPYIAKRMNTEYKIAENAEVISSIGVATAMVREEIERTLNNPEPHIIAALVEEAKQRAIEKGALPESLIVHSEHIAERGVLRVVAMGNATLDLEGSSGREISVMEAKELASKVIGIPSNNIELSLDTRSYYVLKGKVTQKRLFLKGEKSMIVVLDKYGRVRLSVDNGVVLDGSASEVIEKIERYLSNKDDLAPQMHLLNDTKLIDFSGMTAAEHISKAIKGELSETDGKVAAIIKIRQ